MNFNTVLTALFIGIAYASWPIVSKYSKASPGWLGVIVMVGTTLVVLLSLIKNLSKTSIPPGKSFLFLAIASIINGFGVYLYILKSADQSIPIGLFVTIVCLVMVVYAPLFDWLLNKQALTLRQFSGMLLAAVAVYLISNSK
jgi:drug/metabolite transporter (DMT)-like permease